MRATNMLKTAAAAGLSLLAGCDLGLDPDGLVRDLRVLGMRVGAAGPTGVADVELSQPTLDLTLLSPSPFGPGRRVQTERPVTADWYLCLTGRSPLATVGSVDPTCTKFDNRATGPQPNDARVYLASGVQAQVALAPLVQVLSAKVAGMLGSAGGGNITLPLALQLPVVVRATNLPGSSDIRDEEVGFAYARSVFPPNMPATCPAGVTSPCPNRNPALASLKASWTSGDDAQAQLLSPCEDGKPCARLRVPRGAPTLYLIPDSQPGSAEVYVPLDQSGRTQATEVLRYSWFATDGKFSEERTGGDQLYTVWGDESPYQVPAETSVVQLWVVLQDDRGGTDWRRYELEMTTP